MQKRIIIMSVALILTLGIRAGIDPQATYMNKDVEETVWKNFSGEAPLHVSFTAGATDLEPNNSIEWRITHRTSGTKVTRYEEDFEYEYEDGEEEEAEEEIPSEQSKPESKKEVGSETKSEKKESAASSKKQAQSSVKSSLSNTSSKKKSASHTTYRLSDLKKNSSNSSNTSSGSTLSSDTDSEKPGKEETPKPGSFREIDLSYNAKKDYLDFDDSEEFVLETMGEPSGEFYGEDENYCSRALYHGFGIGVVPSAKAVHDRASRNEAKERKVFRNFYMKSLTLLADPSRKCPVCRYLYIIPYSFHCCFKYRSLLPLKYLGKVFGKTREALSVRRESMREGAFIRHNVSI